MPDRFVRLGLIAGLVGVLLVTLGSVIAAVSYVGRQGQSYSPLNHWVSELGEQTVSARADVFNLGLIVGGACFVVFMLTVGHIARGPFGVAGAIVGVIASISASLVGVFPMNDLSSHAVVALAFFGLGWVAVVLLTVALRQRRLVGAGVSALAIATAGCFVAFLVVLFAEGVGIDALAAPSARQAVSLVTILEWLVVSGVSAWVATVAIVLLRHPGSPTSATVRDGPMIQ